MPCMRKTAAALYRVRKVHKAIRVPLVHKDLKARKVRRVFPEMMVLMARKVYKARPVRRVRWVPKALQELMVPRMPGA